MKGIRRTTWPAVIAIMLVVAGHGKGAEPPADEQLQRVRGRIESLEVRLGRIVAENQSTEDERIRLLAELELAEARVRENELLLERSQTEAETVRAVAVELAEELEDHRRLLVSHLEIVALLGRPGTLQLLVDGTRGGDLESAISTVAVLTGGQLRLVEEYGELHRRRSARLAELSRILEVARTEAWTLVERRTELDTVRARVEARVRELARSRRNTVSELDELRQREEALGRLMETLADRRRLTGAEDIRRFKGALPWPVSGTVKRSFGKHFLPKYSTYTVNNGLRFDSPSGVDVKAVFPGEVAFARFFKGYGNMVVIDHGHDVYSLAAGLATIHVRVNQRVDMGLRLGLAAPPSEDGNVYFEIRVGKKPQDPVRWLQLREESPE